MNCGALCRKLIKTFILIAFFYALAPAAPVYSAGIWYVNVNAGFDTNSGSETEPFATISKAMLEASSGDTVMVAAGIYSETVVIDTDYISIIGDDSSSTIIDFSDSSAESSASAFYADTQTGILIKNLQIKNYYAGVEWSNISNSRIENVWINHCRDFGILLYNNSDTNVLTGNTISDINVNGFGILLEASGGNTLTNNKSSNTVWDGFSLWESNGNLLENNISLNSNWAGFYLGKSNGNILKNNISLNNSRGGFYLYKTENCGLTSNISSNNATADGHGFYINDSLNNYFAQNTADSNQGYGFYITNNSAADTFNRNNIITSPLNPDLGVYNGTANEFYFNRCWWNTADSAALADKIQGAGAGLIYYSPYRLSVIYTALGADTIAPIAPDTVSAEAVDSTAIKITWSAVNIDEEGNPLHAGKLAGYKIYRSLISDTSYWKFLGNAAADATQYADTGLSALNTYYYKVTAFDTADAVNESFYSDSTAWAKTPCDSAVIADIIFSSSADFSDTAWIENGIWFDYEENPPPQGLAVLPLNSQTPSFYIKLNDRSGLADTFAVYADSGSGFTLLGETAVTAGVGIIETEFTLAPETNTVKIEARGSSALIPKIDTGLFFIDLTTPAVQFPERLIETGALYASSASVGLTFGADAGGAYDTGPGGISYFKVSDTNTFDTANPSTKEIIFADTLYTAHASSISGNGILILYFRFYDRAGNASDIYSCSVTVIETPAVSITCPAGNHDTNVKIITVSGTASNAAAGDTVEIWANNSLNSTAFLNALNGDWNGTAALTGAGENVWVKLTNHTGKTAYDTITVNYYAVLADTVIISAQDTITVQIDTTATLVIDVGDSAVIFNDTPVAGQRLSYEIKFDSNVKKHILYTRPDTSAYGFSKSSGINQSSFDTFINLIADVKVYDENWEDTGKNEEIYDTIIITLELPPQFLSGNSLKISDLELFVWSAAENAWRKEDDVHYIFPDDNTIKAYVKHFTVYGFFIPAAPITNLNNTVVYPNPFRPEDGRDETGTYARGIFFGNLMEGTKVEIFDVLGRKIDEGTLAAGENTMRWRAENSKGRRAAPGVYVAVFTNGNNKAVRKIFIIR